MGCLFLCARKASSFFEKRREPLADLAELRRLGALALFERLEQPLVLGANTRRKSLACLEESFSVVLSFRAELIRERLEALPKLRLERRLSPRLALEKRLEPSRVFCLAR